jgi:hypothetical protein
VPICLCFLLASLSAFSIRVVMFGSVVSTVPSSDYFVFRVFGSRCGFRVGLLWLEGGSNLSFL